MRARAGPSPRLRPCRHTGAPRPHGAPPAATVRPHQTARANANAPGQLARTAAHGSDSTTYGPTRVEAIRKSTHQRSLTTTPTHADHNALQTHLARFPIRSSPASRSSPRQLPRLRLPSPPVYLRSSDRFSWSFFMVLMLFSVPSCLPPPRLRPSTPHAWAALPGVCLQVEE